MQKALQGRKILQALYADRSVRNKQICLSLFKGAGLEVDRMSDWIKQLNSMCICR